MRNRSDALIDACDQVAAKAALAAWARQSGKSASSVSARPAESGWRIKVDIDDLSRVTHDPLLAQLRYRLRKHHGAPKEGKKIGVPCVFSREAGCAHAGRILCAIDGDGSLNCHGYGSVVSVTATFGLCAAGWVIEFLARRTCGKRRKKQAIIEG
jgi:tRNA A37 threonylcarbamoyladenosine dehydratase